MICSEITTPIPVEFKNMLINDILIVAILRLLREQLLEHTLPCPLYFSSRKQNNIRYSILEEKKMLILAQEEAEKSTLY